MSLFTRIRRVPAQRRTTTEDDLTANGPSEDGTGDPEPNGAADSAGAGGVVEVAGAEADATADGNAGRTAADETGDRRSAKRRVAASVVTVLAVLFVLFTLIAPNNLSRFTPGAFVRIPVEGLIAVALALVLPLRWRRIVAVLLGLIFALLFIVKLVDIGFFAVLDRPFNLVFDWPLLSDGYLFVKTSAGQAGAIGAVIGIAVLALAVLVFMVLSLLRLNRLVVRHRTGATRGVMALGVVWAFCGLFGAQIAPGLPVAAVASGRSMQIPTSLGDKEKFASLISADSFRGTPGSQLLTALHGKDVLLAFVESYGQAAVDNARFAPQVDSVLDAGTKRLQAAGFDSRSAWLRSPTAGGGSWLAHSTLLSGVWVDNQQRYQNLLKSDRLTLNNAFKRAGWRTVGVMPGTTGPWPEDSFYGYQKVYNRWHLGYQGPRFNWGMPPDQYTLSAFQKYERTPGHSPVMAEMPMVSSHAPWAPTPRMIDWKKVGDGSAFDGMPQTGNQPGAVWRDPNRVRDAYRDSIEYSLNALIGYIQTYGDKNLVVVFLGDHQAAPIVSGTKATHNVPVTIVAGDHAVLDKISSWGWQQGLRPSDRSPVWPMDAFRNRFLTAFGSQPATR